MPAFTQPRHFQANLQHQHQHPTLQHQHAHQLEHQLRRQHQAQLQHQQCHPTDLLVNRTQNTWKSKHYSKMAHPSHPTHFSHTPSAIRTDATCTATPTYSSSVMLSRPYAATTTPQRSLLKQRTHSTPFFRIDVLAKTPVRHPHQSIQHHPPPNQTQRPRRV